jgi:hypothetical protein
MKHLPVVFAALLLLLMGILAGGAARRESITVDEVAHIGAGVSYLQKLDLRMNLEHPPLAKALAAIPLVLRGVRTDYSDLSWLIVAGAGTDAFADTGAWGIRVPLWGGIGWPVGWTALCGGLRDHAHVSGVWPVGADGCADHICLRADHVELRVALAGSQPARYGGFWTPAGGLIPDEILVRPSTFLLPWVSADPAHCAVS